MDVNTRVLRWLAITLALLGICGSAWLFLHRTAAPAMPTPKLHSSVNQASTAQLQQALLAAHQNAPTPPQPNIAVGEPQSMPPQYQNRYQAYVDQFAITGEMTIEDNWCIAEEDLTLEQQVIAEEQKNQWLLSRGYVETYWHSQESNTSFNRNEAFILPYKYLSDETLKEYATDDNLMAVITLMHRTHIPLKTKLRLAKQAIQLGDTKSSLQLLIVEHLKQANSAFGQQRVKVAKQHMEIAFTYAHFGRLRGDISGLKAFLILAKSNMREDNTGMTALLDHNAFNHAATQAQALYHLTNDIRLNKYLDEFVTEVPHVGHVDMWRELAFLYDNYPNIMTGSWLPLSYQQDYLAKSPCVERYLAHFSLIRARHAEQQKITQLSP